jgi:CTP-dependent riboflavin kinase
VAGVEIRGVIFSDLGSAKVFMALDWVKRAVADKAGFPAYPGTLNVEVKEAEDKALWSQVKRHRKGIEIVPPDPAFCPARLYPAEIADARAPREKRLPAAVLLPGVEHYPDDKIEIVAAVNVKERLGLRDGDALIVEFRGS